MTVQIVRLTRVFRFGATELPDTDPTASPETVLSHYHGAYPFLAMAKVGEPTEEGDRLVYPIQKPEAQTKGRALKRLTKAQRDALARAVEIANAPAQSGPDNARQWNGVAMFTSNLLRRSPTPVADAMMVPML
ncbi:PRTRC system protein C [Luteimonas sp. MHLX1A]|uniref:PRTRC system protein C n=1 Tax=Alterluteimonas muca TaxID=2878684 RepID=UPI001E28BBA6|nr:PRTRC system protein C [Luteimonas sp. MHLX1A]MCD9046757.1 hypothetical protein [Luteimonas sp. MHLX1A]